MDDSAPPPELTRRKLSIRRKNGRLILATPVARHPIMGGLLMLLPLVFWAIQLPGSGKEFSMTSGIEQRWLAFLLDHVLPDPTSVPLPMQLAAAGFFLIGLVILFHGMAAVIDRNGVSTVHTMFGLPYYRASMPVRHLASFKLSTNGSFSRSDGGVDHLYCVIANCKAPPTLSLCGFPLQAKVDGREIWQEWLAFSLPGENAGDYVLALVQQACPLPTTQPSEAECR